MALYWGGVLDRNSSNTELIFIVLTRYNFNLVFTNYFTKMSALSMTSNKGVRDDKK